MEVSKIYRIAQTTQTIRPLFCPRARTKRKVRSLIVSYTFHPIALQITCPPQLLIPLSYLSLTITYPLYGYIYLLHNYLSPTVHLPNIFPIHNYVPKLPWIARARSAIHLCGCFSFSFCTLLATFRPTRSNLHHLEKPFSDMSKPCEA